MQVLDVATVRIDDIEVEVRVRLIGVPTTDRRCSPNSILQPLQRCFSSSSCTRCRHVDTTLRQPAGRTHPFANGDQLRQCCARMDGANLGFQLGEAGTMQQVGGLGLGTCKQACGSRLASAITSRTAHFTICSPRGFLR